MLLNPYILLKILNFFETILSFSQDSFMNIPSKVLQIAKAPPLYQKKVGTILQ